MGGRRMLCQTLNAEFSPKGIHVAHILIDGAVDARFADSEFAPGIMFVPTLHLASWNFTGGAEG